MFLTKQKTKIILMADLHQIRFSGLWQVHVVYTNQVNKLKQIQNLETSDLTLIHRTAFVP